MQELIHHFGIDWKLLAAQAANFAILVFLLTKFAYRPIMRMLSARKREIEGGLRFAEEAKEELTRIAEKKEVVLQEARSKALAIVTDAEATAKERAAAIAAGAVRKSETIISDAKRALAEERAKMDEAVFAGAEELVRLGLARVLGKLPPNERDRPLVEEALRELKKVA
ncbi:MAG: F0F1 ATP synthase subunit B [Patescibacteria group bacterium]